MLAKRLLLVATVALASGCTYAGSPPPATRAEVPRNAPLGWPVRTAQYVDLWFHGYAMVVDDTAKVPLFDRGYRSRMQQVRSRLNVVTALDANRDSLAAGLARNPALLNGMFAAFDFASFDEMVRITQQFVANEGSPRTVNDPTAQALFETLRRYFRTVADREWLRRFVMSLQEEQTRFYLSHWNAQHADRAATRQAIDAAWTGTYRQKFERILRNERLVDGSFVLSLPLGGEGRTVISPAGNAIATAYPGSPDSAMNAIYTFAHEVTGTLAQRAIQDNTTPAEQREGIIDRVLPIASVRAGAELLQRIAPELLAGYQRFYLRQAGAAVPAGDPAAAFLSTFDVPVGIRDGVIRQIELALAGI